MVDDGRVADGFEADVAAGNAAPAAVEVRTMVATDGAPLLAGDSVTTDVINAVVAAGVGDGGCADVCAEDWAADEVAPSAELEDC